MRGETETQNVSKKPHIRIERVTNGGGAPTVATKDRYVFVGEDGSETEISYVMRGVEISAMYGNVWEATFKTPFIHLVEVCLKTEECLLLPGHEGPCDRSQS